jgi:hypothetical protein
MVELNGGAKCQGGHWFGTAIGLANKKIILFLGRYPPGLDTSVLLLCPVGFPWVDLFKNVPEGWPTVERMLPQPCGAYCTRSALRFMVPVFLLTPMHLVAKSNNQCKSHEGHMHALQLLFA